MDVNTLELLTGEIERQLELLETLEIGSEEYKRTVEGVTKLYDQKTNIEIAISNADLEAKKQETNTELECVKANNEHKKIKNAIVGDLLKNGITLGLGIGSIALTIWGAKHSWNYEDENSYTSVTSKGFIQRLFPKK